MKKENVIRDGRSIANGEAKGKILRGKYKVFWSQNACTCNMIIIALLLSYYKYKCTTTQFTDDEAHNSMVSL